MSPSYARLRPATGLLVACLLGTLCIAAHGKSSTRPRANPTDRATHQPIDPPTNLNAYVFCNNSVQVTWDYDPEKFSDIVGFFVSVCYKDGSDCVNRTIDSKTRGAVYDHPRYSTVYQANVYAFRHLFPTTSDYSSPAQVAFTTYPKIPNLNDLTVAAVSQTALKAQWTSKWNDKIKFSVCSYQMPCKNETVSGKDLEHTFTDLEPGTTYVVSAQAEATVNNRTCKGNIQKKSASTFSIDPPTNLTSDVDCDNQVELTWEYDVMKESTITGFLIGICKVDGSYCNNNTASARSRKFTSQLSDYDSTYHVNIAAFYTPEGSPAVYSRSAQELVTSYPKIPGLDDITITATSSRALRAQWNTEWSSNILFSICSEQQPCQNETVSGEKQEHTFNELKPRTLYTVSAQAEATLNNRTCQGPIHKASATTLPLEAPANLMVTQSCDGSVHATWQYQEPDNIDGFITQLCYKNGSSCRNQTLPATSRDTTYAVTEPSTPFNISVRAYVDGGYTSAKDQLTFTSFPELPGLDDLSVSGLSPTEVQATWSENRSYVIEFVICRDFAQCKKHIVPGNWLTYTFSDLEPDTEYSVSAQAEISVKNTTCKGHKQERHASTLRIDPPTDLAVNVLCTKEASVTWNYNVTEWLTGFVASLCYESDQQHHCKNQSVSRTEKYCSFALPVSDAAYNVTVWAYHKGHRSTNKTFSPPAETNFTSYPNLPELTNITIAGVSTTELVGTWQDEWTGDIYFTVCSSPVDCHNETARGTQHSHSFHDLHPNTTYTVDTKTGSTLNNKTCFGPVHKLTASTFVQTPGKVRNLKGNIVNGTVLEASWDAPKDQEEVTGYTVQCRDSDTHYNQSEDVAGGKESKHVSFTLHEITATFNCSVQAYNRNTSGLDVYGHPESFEVTTNGIEAPKNVTLVAKTATSLTFTWSADPNATKCEVEVHREGDYEEPFGRIEACGESVNGTITHNVTDLYPWTSYNVSIKNCRDTFCGEPVMAVNTTEVAAPSEVRNFSYAIENDVSVQFTWVAPEHPNGPLDGYRLLIFDEDAQDTKLINLPATYNNATLDLKFQFHLFNVSIAAFNYDNTTSETLYSSEAELKFETLGKGPVPPRPKAEDVKENSVLLAWEEPDDPRYNITAFEVKVAGQTPFTTTAHNVTIEHLSPWTNYEANVSSCMNKSDCGQDRHFRFRTDFGAPSAPEDFKAPSAGTHWMLVKWEKPKVLNGPLSGYNLTFSHGGSKSQVITTELSYNATDLVPGTSYEVAVFAFNEVQSVIKHGPAVTLQATTQADTPSGASTATIVLAVLIPLLFLVAVAAYFLYKRYRQRTGERTPLTSAVDS